MGRRGLAVGVAAGVAVGGILAVTVCARPAPAVVAFLPDGADLVVRFGGRRLADAPALARALARDDFASRGDGGTALADSHAGGLLGAVRRRAGEDGGWDAARRLVGDDALLARCDGEWLLVARLSAAGRALLAEESPLASVTDGSVSSARFRDVLVAATSEDLVEEALDAARRGPVAADGPADLRHALGGDEPPVHEIRVRLGDAAIDDGALLLRKLGPPWSHLPLPDDVAGASVRIDLSNSETIPLTLDLASLPEARADRAANRSARAYADAAALAPESEAVWISGAAEGAGEALARLLETIGPGAADRVAGLAAEAASHLDPAFGLVASRLPENAGLALDRAGDGAVLPRLAWTVVVRPREDAPREAAAAALLRAAQAAVPGDWTQRTIGGTTLHESPARPTGDSRCLLRPAVAVRGDVAALSTCASTLVRDPSERAPDATPASAEHGAGFLGVLRGSPLRAWIDDLRWEAAESATRRDWDGLRRWKSIATNSDPALSGASAEARAASVERWIDDLRRRRDDEESPAAVAAHRARWEFLRQVAEVRVAEGAGPAGRRMTIEIRLVPARPGR